MRKISLFLPLLMAVGLLSASAQQSYDALKMPQLLPPSPEAFQLGSYGTVPVGLFSGTMSLNIPLYEIKTRNLSVPISLNYSSNGIKVDLPASRVGTDWIMQAGGVITRTIYGKEDFVHVRPALPPSFTTPSNALRDYLDAVTEGADSQADFYNFNFNSYSGKFYFTRTGEIVTFPYQPNLRIIQNPGSPTVWHFKVITPAGEIYYFGGTGAVEKSKTVSGGSGCPNTNYPFTENAWYLKKIVHPFGDSIEFNYSNVNYTYISNFSQSIEKKYPVNQYQYTCQPGDYRTTPPFDVYPPEDSWSTCYSFTTNNGCVLSSIRFSDGYVKFSNAVRYDLPGDSCLSAISVYGNNSSSPIKVIDLEQAYATADLSYDNSIITDFGGSVRLFLTAVKELYPNTTTAGKVHTFDYYDTANLAPRLSMAQDHFGYFNGANNSWFFPATSTYGNLFLGLGGDRAPNFSYASRGLLKKITYPTGGYTEIFYEQNLLKSDRVGYPTEGQTAQNGHLYVGGARVAKVINFDAVANKPEIRRFFYTYMNDTTQSSGDLVFQPIYFSDKMVHKLCEISLGGNGCEFTQYPMKVIHSNSIFPIYGATNGTVVYNEVRESLGENFENGGILHRYYAERDPLPQVLHGNLIPSGNSENLGVLNGLEYETLFYSIENGNIVKRKQVKNKYRVLDGLNSSSAIFKIDTGILVNRIGTMCQATNMTPAELDLYDINKYLTFSSFTYNDSAFVYEYDSKGQNSLLTLTINRYDNLQYLQKTSEKTFTSTGDSIVTEYKYSYDFKSPGNVYQKMVDANILAPIVETKVKKNTTTLGIVKTNYADWYSNSKILVPKTVEFTHTSYSPEVRLQYHNYSTKGELLEVSEKDNVRKSYVWNITASYPLAEVANGLSSEIAYTSFEDDGPGNWTFSGTPFVDNPAATGRKVYKLSTGNITKSGLNSSSTYIVTYWSKNGAQSVNGSTSAVASFASGSWQLYRHTIVNPAGGTITISGSGTIDELRLHPEQALMKSFVYSPLVGITAASDEQGRLSFYEYDELQRLIVIRDQDKNIVKKICYNYAGQPENCTIYYNTQKSGVFTRSCTPPLAGSQVTYTVPAGTYSSTISQGKADTLALNDVAANGQAFANANGTCTTPTIYVSIQLADWYYDVYDTYATVIIKFYSDAARTIPISVSNLSVNYKRTQLHCAGWTGSTNNYNINCSGNQVSLGMNLISHDDGLHCYDYLYEITAGTGYVVNN